MSSRSRSPERVSFANINEALPLPDLISIQRDSFQWFLDKGLAEAFSDISPIEDFTGQLSLELEFDPSDADLRPPPKFSVEECKEKDMTYAAPVFVRARFLNATTGEIKEQTVFMGDFPMMTDRGTFIVNGTERVVVSQLVRSPGVIFQPGRDAKTVFTGTIHPYRGEWIELDIEAKPGRTSPRAAASRASAGCPSSCCCARSGTATRPSSTASCATSTSSRASGRRSATSHRRAKRRCSRSTSAPAPASRSPPRRRAVYFENAFFNPKRYDLTRVGRYKLNRKLGPEIDRLSGLFGIEIEKPAPDQSVLSPSEILASATYMLHLALHMADGESTYRIDDQDHFANRRIRSVGELIQNQVRVGSEPDGAGRARAHDDPGRRGHHAADADQHPPGRGRGQGVLRHLAAEPVHGPEQPAVGAGAQAPPLGARAQAACRVSAPASRSATSTPPTTAACARSRRPRARTSASSAPWPPTPGSTSTASSRRRTAPSSDGIVTNDVNYLAADEEEEHVIAQANASVDADGRLTEDRVLVRRGPQGTGVRMGAVGGSYGTTSEIDFVPPSEVDLMDVSPKQIVSVSTALIPFVEHDDANRALMGANMQKQAVPLVMPEAPYIGTGRRGPRRPRRRRRAPGRGQRHGHRDQR